jgi:hypothetical protein
MGGQMFSKNFLVSGLLVILGLSMTACSSTSSSWVSGVGLATAEQNGDEYVTVSTQLKTGSIALIPISLPIMNPKNLLQQIGQIDLKSSLGGSAASELDISLDMTQILNLPAGSSMGVLPNGTQIPVSGVNSANWISLPVQSGKSRVYVNVDVQNKKVALGVAVSIDQLAIGVPANLLLPFSASGVSGVAGVYTGVAAGQSGFALFVDASSLLSSSSVSSKLAFAVQKSSGAAQVQQKLYELDMKAAKLRAQ